MHDRKSKNATLSVLVVLLTTGAMASCSDANQVAPPSDQAAANTAQELLPLTLSGNNRAVTKLPLIIAWDQGLFEKHGLDMNLLLPGPDYDGGREIPPKPGMEDEPAEIVFRGATPMLLNAARNPDEPHQIDIGSTDCAVRGNVVGRMGIEAEISTLEDLRGKRIGISNVITVQGFQARLLAERMGWDYTQDLTLIDVEGDGLEELAEGSVDILIATELTYSAAKSAGYPILFDFGDWGEEAGGNSIAVDPPWLEDPVNREKARRLLMAVAEAISIFHQQPEVAAQILREWNGIQDPVLVQDIIERGAWLPRKPYACVAGLQKTVELFPEIVAGRFTAEDFYDNSIMEEIDATGYLDELYR